MHAAEIAAKLCIDVVTAALLLRLEDELDLRRLLHV